MGGRAEDGRTELVASSWLDDAYRKQRPSFMWIFQTMTERLRLSCRVGGGDAEVGELHTTGEVDENVGGLEVAVDDAQAVQGRAPRRVLPDRFFGAAKNSKKYP